MGNVTGTCRNGHVRTDANTTFRNGIRTCLDCQREKGRKPMKRTQRPVRPYRPRGRQNRASEDVHQLSLAEAVRLVTVEFETVSAAARLSGRSRGSVSAAAWEKVKGEARSRDRNTCTKCRRAGSSLDVHHRLPKGIGGAASKIAYGLANLVTLCRDCHGWAHAHPVDAMACGLVLARHDEPEEHPVVLPGRIIWMDYQGERRTTR